MVSTLEMEKLQKKKIHCYIFFPFWILTPADKFRQKKKKRGFWCNLYGFGTVCLICCLLVGFLLCVWDSGRERGGGGGWERLEVGSQPQNIGPKFVCGCGLGLEKIGIGIWTVVTSKWWKTGTAVSLQPFLYDRLFTFSNKVIPWYYSIEVPQSPACFYAFGILAFGFLPTFSVST